MQFQPGDKLLVKVFHALDKESHKKLQKTVEKWAGDHVEVLIVDTTKMEISVDRGSKRSIII